MSTDTTTEQQVRRHGIRVLFEDQPEYALLLSWHISNELIENLRRKNFRGKFIVPLPTPQILP